LVTRFENLEEILRDQYIPEIYLQMWTVALDAGKINLANRYIEKSFCYLIENKRSPQIKLLLKKIEEIGIYKKSIGPNYAAWEILLGKRKTLLPSDLTRLDFLLTHADHWKNSSLFLKNYLLNEEEWRASHWKLCYEYILLNSFDREIFNLLLTKSEEIQNTEFENQILDLMKSKKIKVRHHETIKKTALSKEDVKYNVDYDQLAIDHLSGIKEATLEEQKIVMTSLKFVSDEELRLKGHEMIVAFELLGMELVVIFLCEKLLPLLSDVKQRASTVYVWTMALLNNREFYKAIELIDDALAKEPLYGEEKLALLYLKGEAFLNLKKNKTAKEIFLLIKKQHPHYRLVEERLKILETN
jgi:hypothetical protein